MERLCIVCASLAGKQLDIEEGCWQLGTCPDCQRSKQLLWPVNGESTLFWARKTDRNPNRSTCSL
ncbi:MAG: hypothetical protein AAF629_00925 [Chloroflexota bacterium]